MADGFATADLAELAYLRAEVDRLRDQVLAERPLPVVKGLRTPFPWFGSKRIAAPLIWSALGNPGNLVIPFAGSLAELWARPEPGKVETVNDADGLLCNVWRAIQRDPDAVAEHADHPVVELDLHAWHRHLVEAAPVVKAKLQTDPRYYDAELRPLLTATMAACLIELEARHDPLEQIDVLRRIGREWTLPDSESAYPDSTINALWGMGLLRQVKAKSRRFRLTPEGRQRAQELRGGTAA